MAKASDNQFPKVTFAESSAPSTPASGLGFLYEKTDGKVYFKNDGGTEYDLTSTGAGGTGTATKLVRARRTAGNVTASSTTWANVDTGLDLTIAAVAGDILMVSVSARIITSAGGSGTSPNATFLDAVTVVSASPLNSVAEAGAVSGTSEGVQAWRGATRATDTTSLDVGVGGPAAYVVQAGDLVSGSVTLRLRYRIDTVSSRTNLIVAGTNNALVFMAMNTGQ